MALHQSPQSAQAGPVDAPRVLYVRDSHAEPGHVLAVVEVPGTGLWGVGCACGVRHVPLSTMRNAVSIASMGCGPDALPGIGGLVLRQCWPDVADALDRALESIR